MSENIFHPPYVPVVEIPELTKVQATREPFFLGLNSLGLGPLYLGSNGTSATFIPMAKVVVGTVVKEFSLFMPVAIGANLTIRIRYLPRGGAESSILSATILAGDTRATATGPALFLIPQDGELGILNDSAGVGTNAGSVSWSYELPSD